MTEHEVNSAGIQMQDYIGWIRRFGQDKADGQIKYLLDKMETRKQLRRNRLGVDMARGQADKTAVQRVEPAPAPTLPKGATRHKALPAACLDRMDDRAAFIGRWEQK